MEPPIKMDDLGVSPFQETSIFSLCLSSTSQIHALRDIDFTRPVSFLLTPPLRLLTPANLISKPSGRAAGSTMEVWPINPWKRLALLCHFAHKATNLTQC